ncbi:MAG: hypothetical protein IJN50_06940 [Clostridia bacterium]|nr:hypothetical protein [Clostridia bacterium]
MKKISINMMKIVVVLMIGIFAIGMSLGVNAAEVKDIKVKVKGGFEYGLNDEIEEDKFQFIAVDAEGWEKDVTEEVEMVLPELNELGEHEVIVKYGELQLTFTITVVEAEEVLPDEELEEEEVIVTPEDPEEDMEEDLEEDMEEDLEEDMDDVVEDATDGGFDFMGTMSGIMEFLQPLLDTLLNSILPMIMNTVLPMAVDAASTLIPMAIDVGVPAITTLIGAIF